MTKKRRRGPQGSESVVGAESVAESPPVSRPSEAGSAPELVPVPRWLPPVLYGLATLVLFRAFVLSDQMLLSQDTLSLGYAARAFYADAVKTLGTFPLWNPQILGGTPFLESLAGGDSLYPTALLLFVMETYRALGWKLVLHVFVAGLLMHGWLRYLGVSRAAALLGGLAYLLAPFMVTLVYPGHDGKIFVTALTPLMFWMTERGFRQNTLGAWAAVGLTVSLVLFTTHFQMAYFLFGAVGCYAAFRAIQMGRGEGGRVVGARFGLFLAAALVGAGGAAVQLIPAANYVTEHSRRAQTTTEAEGAAGAAYASSWSLHPEEAVSMIVPEFAGNTAGGAAWSTNTYWGRNAFKLNHEYAGLVVVLLAMLAFFGGPQRGLRFFLAGLGAVALLFALGAYTPVWWFFFKFVPGVSLFRAPSSVAWLFGFSAITLMAFGVDRALTSATGEETEWKRASSLLGAVALLLVIGAVLTNTGKLTDLWTSLLYSDIDDGKRQALAVAQPFIARGFFFATLLTLGTLGTLFAARRGVSAAAVVALLGVLLAADAMRVDNPFIRTLDFHQWSAPDANVRYLTDRLRGGEPFRVLSLMPPAPGQDVMPATYGLDLAGGHHPNDLGRYRELIGMVGSGLPQNLVGNAGVMAGLNVRYILWSSARFGPIEGLGVPHLEGLREVSRATLPDGRVISSLYAFPGLPRARLVSHATVVPEGGELAALLDPSFDVAASVVLTEDPPISLSGAPASGSVTWEEHTPNRLRLNVTSDQNAILVVADNWFPAWKATVDGEDVPVLRANHTLRAVAVTAGEHVVELRYASAELRNMLLLTLGCLLALAGAVVGAAWRERRGS